MKYFIWALRIIVGVLFIFSGLIKANDPLGLSYKMDEFFEIWGMYWAMPFSLSISIAMIAFEIIAGVAVLLGYAYRVFSFLLLALITFFTFLTAYVLFSGKIKECGCFGDCIKISNEETFWKDVVLLVMGLILFLYRNKIKPVLSGYPGTAIMILTAFFAVGIQFWHLEHLPTYDCLPFKVGVDVNVDRKIPEGATPDRYESVMIYEKDGVQKEFTMDNYPWEDSTWVFVDRKDVLVEKGNAEPKIHDYIISDYNGNEYTNQILNTPGYTFLLYVKDTDKARDDNKEALQEIIAFCNTNDIPFYVLCSANEETAMAFKKDWSLNAEFLVLDGTVSKTAMRSNPGLMLLEQGVIKGKWSYRDYPEDISLENGKLNYD